MKRCSVSLITREMPWDLPLHPLGVLLSQKRKITSADKDVGNSNPLALLLGTQNSTAALGNRAVGPQKIKNRPYDPEFNFLDWKQGLKVVFAYPCSQQRYLQQPKGGSNQNGHKQMNTRHVWCSIISLDKEGILAQATTPMNLEDTVLIKEVHCRRTSTVWFQCRRYLNEFN